MGRSLTNHHIKLLAAVLMVVDHVGYIFFTDDYSYRAIGRLSFPLFVWLLVQGEKHTRNVRRYGLRLLLMGLISQPIYMLVFAAQDLNILFTLLIGLICLRASRLFPDYQVLAWVVGGILAEGVKANYGAYGIVLTFLLWRFKPEAWWWVGWTGLHVLLLIVEPEYGSFQFPAVLAPLLLQLTNHQQGAKARWFYLFYPVHLLVLYGIRVAIQVPAPA